MKGLVSMNPIPAWLIDCAGWKQKRQGCLQRWEDGEGDEEQWGETEDSYVLWMRSSGWLWGRSPTPPSAPHASLSLSLSLLSKWHTMAFCALMGQTHTRSFLPAYTEVCLQQALSVKQDRNIARPLHVAFVIWLIIAEYVVQNHHWVMRFMQQKTLLTQLNDAWKLAAC